MSAIGKENEISKNNRVHGGAKSDRPVMLLELNDLLANSTVVGFATQTYVQNYVQSNTINQVLTGFVSGAGTVSASDTILTALQKLAGNDNNKLPLTGGVMTGTVTYTSSSNTTTFLASTTNSYLIGAGNTTDLYNATSYNRIYFDYWGTEATKITSSDGTAVSEILVYALGNISSTVTKGSDQVQLNITSTTAKFIATSTFAGLSYDTTTAGYVNTNKTSNSILHMGANDARYLAKSGGTMTGTLTLNADATSGLQAVTYQQMIAAVAGLWDDRGNYDASSNTFPSTGGSGTAGAILKGDIWTISVVGTLGGVAVGLGDTVRALVDSPGSTASNWALGMHDYGYTPLSNTLNSAYIFVGNSSNVATGVALSGDASISNTGALTVSKIGGKTVTLGGNVTFSGAYNFTGTLSNTTSVTFPTTGTLATLAGSETFTNKTLTSPTMTTPTLGVASATSVNFGGTNALDTFDYGTYSPSWTNAGTANSLGNGTLQGYWQKVGKICYFQIYFQAGSTTSYGSSNFYFSLPFTSNTSNVANPVMTANLFTNATGHYYNGVAVLNSSTTVGVYSDNGGAKWQSTVPATWQSASNTFMTIQGYFWL